MNMPSNSTAYFGRGFPYKPRELVSYGTVYDDGLVIERFGVVIFIVDTLAVPPVHCRRAVRFRYSNGSRRP